MYQRLNTCTGESNNFYFGIFICCGPLKKTQASAAANVNMASRHAERYRYAQD